MRRRPARSANEPRDHARRRHRTGELEKDQPRSLRWRSVPFYVEGAIVGIIVFVSFALFIRDGIRAIASALGF